MPHEESTLYVTIEGTPGTEEHPPAGGAALDYDECRLAPMGEGIDRAVIRTTGGKPAPKTPDERWMDVRIGCEVKAATAAGAAPDIDVLLKAAGFAATEDAGVSWTYDLGSSVAAVPTVASASIRQDFTGGDGGHTRRASGVRGTLGLEWSPDTELEYSFTGMGEYVSVTDAPASVAPTYNAGVPLRDLTTATIAADAPVVRRVSIDTGMVLTKRPGGGASASGGAYWPAHLNWPRAGGPTADLEIEAEDETALANIHTLWTAGTAAALSLVWTAGSRTLTLTGRLGRIRAIEPQPGSQPYVYRVRMSFHQEDPTSANSTPLTLVWA